MSFSMMGSGIYAEFVSFEIAHEECDECYENETQCEAEAILVEGDTDDWRVMHYELQCPECHHTISGSRNMRES